MDYISLYNKYRNQYIMLKGGNDIGSSYSEILEQMLKFIGNDKVMEIMDSSFDSGIFSILLMESNIDIIIIYEINDLLEDFIPFYYKKYEKSIRTVDPNEFPKSKDGTDLIFDKKFMAGVMDKFKDDTLKSNDRNVLLLDGEIEIDAINKFKGDKLILVDYGDIKDRSLDKINENWTIVDNFNLMNYSYNSKLKHTVMFYTRKGSPDNKYKKSDTSHEIASTNQYKFVHFDDHKTQREFIRKHMIELLDIDIGCLPPNEWTNKSHFMNIIHTLTSYIDNPEKYKWYFVMCGDRVIGFCHLYDEEGFVKTDEKIRTYSKYCGPNYMAYYGGEHKCEDGEIMSNDTVKRIFGEYPDITQSELDFIGNYNVRLGPIVNALCKNKKYKEVGAFLLDNLSKTMTGKHQALYLIPESVRFKDIEMDLHIYDDWGASCVVDEKKYIESTNELIKYYEKQGFSILKDTYFAVSCSIKQPTNTIPPEGTFMFYNVLYRKL